MSMSRRVYTKISIALSNATGHAGENYLGSGSFLAISGYARTVAARELRMSG